MIAASVSPEIAYSTSVGTSNTSKTPTTIGHYPKANTNSSLRVKGFQLVTSVAGLPVGKKQRKRTKERQRKIDKYGTLDSAPLSQKQNQELSKDFPTSQILKKIPMSEANLRLLPRT